MLQEPSPLGEGGLGQALSLPTERAPADNQALMRASLQLMPILWAIHQVWQFIPLLQEAHFPVKLRYS
ncbi:MAG: hypothetical protein AB1450_14920 [Pseudomonadota bacterium]